jgi:hypothetical protein
VKAHRVYVASKACHRPMWRRWRENGVPIISSWIDVDDSHIGGTLTAAEYRKLWASITAEVASATALVFLSVAGDEHQKGSLVEVGVALGAGIPVFAVGAPDHSWLNHPGVTICRHVGEAFDHATSPFPWVAA